MTLSGQILDTLRTRGIIVLIPILMDDPLGALRCKSGICYRPKVLIPILMDDPLGDLDNELQTAN